MDGAALRSGGNLPHLSPDGFQILVGVRVRIALGILKMPISYIRTTGQ